MGEEERNLGSLSLRIQLSATAVATSFVLIFVPNVETITLMAFLVGFLFPLRFALVTTLTMVVTWEVIISMILVFSGITFPFKLVAWLIVTLLGRFARKINTKYFYEFIVFGALSALIFDVFVTLSLPLIFINQEEAFIPLLITSLIFGIFFTVSHIISNALFFGMIPVIMRTVLPLLNDNFSHLVRLPRDYFSYLIEFRKDSGEFDSIMIMRKSKRRFLGYFFVFSLILIITGTGVVSFYNVTEAPEEDGIIAIKLTIDYNGASPNEEFDLEINENRSLLWVLEEIALVNYTLDYGPPYVVGINEVWESLPNDYWTFTINDNGIRQDVNSTYFTEGDVGVAFYN